MTPQTVAPVLAAGLLDAAEVGNKFSRLESMRAAGFPVPPLYCLPAAAFDLATGTVRAGLPPLPAAADTEGVRAWGEGAAGQVARLEVPGALAGAALAAFDEVIGPDGLAAVRACVVPVEGGPGEDDASDPFAGMSDSFLYVPRGDLLARIVDCWASAYKPEAVLYRMRRGVDPAATRVAVGVQRMALGTRSFVAFTRDPRDGASRLVIAAAHGIGEGVVQEKADVDHFFVDPATGETRAEPVRKLRMVGPPAPGGPGEPALLDVPPELAVAPVLDDGHIARIAEVAARIERHFGGPQDIEGTFTPDGTLHVVQARPIVTAAAPPAPATALDASSASSARRDSPAHSASSAQRAPAGAHPGPGGAAAGQVEWSNHNITESYPGVSGALTYSLARDFYRWIFTDLYRRMGVPDRTLRRNAHHLARMIGTLDGRIFYRMDAWYALHGQMPVFEFIRGWWEHGMGLAETPRAAPLRPGWRLRALRAAPGLLRRMFTHQAEVRAFLRWWDGIAAAERVDALGPEELVVYYRGLWARVADRWGVTLTNSILGIVVVQTLDGLLRRWAGQDGHSLMLGLLSGGPDNRSLAAVRSAIALAELAGADRRLREDVLAARDPEAARELWERLVSGAYGPRPATAATAYLRRYGDRATGDLKLEEPTPRQRPWTVLDLLRPLVRQGRTVAASRAEELRVRRDAERELRLRCPSLPRRAVIRALSGALRGFVTAREDMRFCRSQLYGLSRRVLFRLGAELAAAGHLDDAADVIDLTVPEVLGAFEGTLPGTALRPLAAHRRAEREHHATLPPPPPRLVTDAGVPLAVPRPLADPASAWPPGTPDGAVPGDPGSPDTRLLRGLASSEGVVRGRAKVVEHPSVPPESCQDRILVARETDPGWLFLMTAAKGLVVERGTLLSHTAITGRLLGVPTVVAVPGATTLIPDGAWVELDGAAGTVRVLEETP
ncbi:PEP/pyruvate-binding domain-containing protein [Sphaerisporangium aureirubrum]|uniref:PEP/pyruvate-binding domain-containing protein n=1 Tax=Sphaerisporangium aureirubrum TaxID=1544736 RepID=A0ABW1NK86_9ACTN